MDIANTALTWTLTQFSGLVTGFIIAVATSFLFEGSAPRTWITAWVKKRKFISLEGVWIEANDDLDDRPFAVCEFYFSHEDGKLRFKGDSYNLKGEVHYHWESLVLRIDQQHRLSYVYDTREVPVAYPGHCPDTPVAKSGFGCIFFELRNTEYIPKFGYFLDLERPIPRNTMMRRFKDVMTNYRLELDDKSPEDRVQLVKKLNDERTLKRTKDFFGWKSKESEGDR